MSNAIYYEPSRRNARNTFLDSQEINACTFYLEVFI